MSPLLHHLVRLCSGIDGLHLRVEASKQVSWRPLCGTSCPHLEEALDTSTNSESVFCPHSRIQFIFPSQIDTAHRKYMLESFFFPSSSQNHGRTLVGLRTVLRPCFTAGLVDTVTRPADRARHGRSLTKGSWRWTGTDVTKTRAIREEVGRAETGGSRRQ